MAELVDATDLKSVGRKAVGVRVPPSANLGLVAQLGEHLLCKQGVAGSNPVRSI